MLEPCDCGRNLRTNHGGAGREEAIGDDREPTRNESKYRLSSWLELTSWQAHAVSSGTVPDHTPEETVTIGNRAPSSPEQPQG